MSNSFLGVSFVIWGAICLAIAAVYVVIWPKPKPTGPAKPRTPSTQFILRWFHAFVWLCLAAACFAWAVGSSRLAPLLAILALVLYVAFILTLLRERAATRAST